MALVMCPECRHSVSSAAAACPQCGYPIAQVAAPPPAKPAAVPKSSRTLVLAGILAAMVGALALVVHSRRAEKFSPRSDQASSTAPPPFVPSTSNTLVDEQVTIKEDFYYSSIIELNRDALVTVSVDLLAGPEIESWTMGADSFRRFEKAGKSFLGGKFEHYPDLRIVDARQQTKSVRLPKGRYYVVFDNSDQGETKPPANFSEDSAQVRIVIRAQ